jgi:hypothetical protein
MEQPEDSNDILQELEKMRPDIPLDQKVKILDAAVQALKQRLLQEKKFREQFLLTKTTLETQVKQATGQWTTKIV